MERVLVSPDALWDEVAAGLKRLRLPAMSAALRQPKAANLARLRWFRDLVRAEVHARNTSALRRRLDQAQLLWPTETLADIDLGRVVCTQADRVCWARADWVRTHRNLAITGNARSVRSRLVSALGVAAASEGFSVRFYDVADLLEWWGTAEPYGRAALRYELRHVDLLVLDGWGVVTLQDDEDEVLRMLLKGRCTARRSILVGSCLPTKDWLAWLGDSHAAAELVENLLAPAFQFTAR
jgi:DNA replication protein DnaC